MFPEDDLLPISAIQHYLFCQRQCALIHTEGVWEENPFTIEGRLLHGPIDEDKRVSRGMVRIVRGMFIRSLRLGLAGKCDVVEFKRVNAATAEAGSCVKLPGTSEFWKPFLIEYKRGRPKPSKCDEAQLCAQAICIEEMMNVRILYGALYYHSIRRRKEVQFDASLRSICEEAAEGLRRLLDFQITPPAVYDNRCKHCSLINLCSPLIASKKNSVSAYIERQIEFDNEAIA